MDAAFGVPTQVLFKHILTLNVAPTPFNHKVIFELGPSITGLGKPIRNLFISLLAIYCLTDLVKTTVKSVLKDRDTK